MPGVQARTQTALERVAATALDPGYAQASAGRPPARPGRRRGSRRARRNRWHSLAMPLALLLTGLLTALTIRQGMAALPAGERLQARLSAEYETRSANRDDLAADVRELRSAIADLRARQRSADDAWDTATARIGALAAPAGLAAARGPGVRLTLTDPAAGPPADAGNPRPTAELTPGGRLADHDLADMVNLLWSAGAEAVAVNGVRLTALSAVRAAGDAILVGLSAVEAPYVLDAIGDSAAIVSRVSAAPVTVRLRTRAGAPPDAVTIARLGAVTLPAAADPSLRYARGSGS
ncbi:Uncharacterized conserved protein YlxW, UPF0749 family [Parafrankia irregularis]|uniref:Uncharacterized conserved protein YlxW, UPF0749 family n=1 Tax=Parafrankia irregularis TaxID=795642 RepID=A0A0S4QV65_9ACTN|nr:MULTISPECIES: DUF881 domain-containing protein [Parafrankia]MBE3201909.1 DUF881 domain-containing protein [Parafrankia sp. CH37]CUU59504.1 Uncharacterized conserved protein YlxW, UPF0749 family [Parafrankia irregularis]